MLLKLLFVLIRFPLDFTRISIALIQILNDLLLAFK